MQTYKSIVVLRHRYIFDLSLTKATTGIKISVVPPVNATKTYGWSRGIAPLILNLGTRCR
jgi:hypothetical protein